MLGAVLPRVTPGNAITGTFPLGKSCRKKINVTLMRAELEVILRRILEFLVMAGARIARTVPG